MFKESTSPNVAKTALDDVFFPRYNTASQPNIATAMTEKVFKQESSDSSATIWEVFKSGGLWGTRSEEQDVPSASPRVTNQKTFTNINYAQSIDISKNLYDDAKFNVIDRMVEAFGDDARSSRDYHAFGLYRNAFGTTTSHDAVALISNSHTNLNGDTIDNLLTGDISETTLNTAIVQLGELKRENGIIGGNVPACVLVSYADYKLACEITGSELRSGTGNNDMNVYSDKYGISVYTSPYLGTAAGGDDDAWFLLSDNIGIFRFVRQGMQTALVPWQNQRNNNYIYKGEFREVTGAMSPDGIVGSAGA